MWPTKQLLQAGVLVVFAIVAAGCGAPIIAETTVGSVEQPVETTSPEPQERVEGEASLIQDNSESTVMSTTMMTLPTLEYSPAWIEYQALELYYEDDSLENTLKNTRAIFITCQVILMIFPLLWGRCAGRFMSFLVVQ